MNAVFILSDRHTASFAGCYGSPVTRTPNLDRLAEQGTRFDAAWCLSPTCAPTRASMITGRFIHEIGTWCNSHPWPGTPRGWSHALGDAGVHYATVGKLDFDPESDHGIAEERLANHRSSRDVTTLYREVNHPRYLFTRRFCETAPADDLRAYRRDVDVADEAARWLANDRPGDRPWVLSVNFSHLHRPWPLPRNLWDHYDALVDAASLDGRYTEPFEALHPCHDAFARYSGGHLVSREQVRRGLVGYHGAVEILDRHIGVVVSALEAQGLLDDTLVIYSSDHGGNCGEHRILDHGGLYEESARIPLVVRGPGVSQGGVVTDPVSLIDIFPTIGQALNVTPPDGSHGTSLWPGLTGGRMTRSEPVICQFHASGFPSGGFATREGTWKYVEWPGYRPALFDLDADPLELRDLVVHEPDAARPVTDRLAARLREIVDPDEADARAKADQAATRRTMIDQGLMPDELWRRGYERTTDTLIPRPEFVIPE